MGKPRHRAERAKVIGLLGQAVMSVLDPDGAETFSGAVAHHTTTSLVFRTRDSNMGLDLVTRNVRSNPISDDDVSVVDVPVVVLPDDGDDA